MESQKITVIIEIILKLIWTSNIRYFRVHAVRLRTVSVYGNPNTVLNRVLSTLHRGSLEITRTVPLMGLFIYLKIHTVD